MQKKSFSSTLALSALFTIEAVITLYQLFCSFVCLFVCLLGALQVALQYALLLHWYCRYSVLCTLPLVFWFNLFLGFNFISVSFGVWWCTIMSLKQRKMIFKTKLKLNHNMHNDYINPFTPNSIPFAMYMQADYRSFGLFPRPFLSKSCLAS